ncbi:ricin B-type lectin domain-containing protein [Chloropicon roscoffensis]|uniref:Ricin B-type lectin domain-containing protein n=1 Tax=Chloropicon roscoffensis TaxID=1461544 RepID=A0AAX4NYY8_9CHLO
MFLMTMPMSAAVSTPIDCEGEWGAYDSCTHVAAEHKNEKCRTYKVTTEAHLNGKLCPFEDNKVECTTEQCSQPVDCVGDWGAYSACFHDVQDHKNRRCRVYAITTNVAHNGYGCPYANAYKQCTTEGCAQPVDCLGAWEEYGVCVHDEEAHKNKKCRTYVVERAASHNGYTCPYADSYVQCSTSLCNQPVDCVGAWDDYAECYHDEEAHDNKRCRLYKVSVASAHNGHACPYADKLEQCTNEGCAQPVDCVGAWSAYDECHYEVADHENERCREYIVSQPALNNGYTCPHEDKLKHCTKSGCGQPIDCEGEWSLYGSCNHVTAGHKNERCRTYKVTTAADLSGVQCPFEDKKVECTTNSCSQPVDCVGDWGSYGACFHDSDDHKNRRCRHYVVSTAVAHNGYGCPYLDNYKQCTTEGCSQPVDCLGAWSEYDACIYDKDMHKNKKCRTYTVERAASHNGYTCPYADSYIQCSTNMCNQPVDCVGAWDKYNDCFYDKDAHKNKKCRTYKVSVAAENNGYACPYANQLEQCTNEGCAQPVDCVGAWATYGECLYKDDDHENERCRVYAVSQVAMNNGYACPYEDKHKHCTKSGCGQPVDCEGAWGSYSACKHVAAGHKNDKCRTYAVNTKAELGGKDCPHKDGLVECTTTNCTQPVDCVGDWGAYSACFHDVQDHKNRRCRVYAITTNVAHNGYGCPYANAYKQCTTEGCAQPVDCLGAWEKYGACIHDEEAHKNKKCRTYVVSRANAHNGYACPYADSYVQCSTELCNQPVDCVGAWDNYSECYHDKDAHDNKRCRTYKISVESDHNGYDCPFEDKLEQCTAVDCSQPVDCVGAWDDFSECSHDEEAHKNKRCRTYKVSVASAHNGHACPYTNKLEQCTTEECAQPVDCVGSWGEYAECKYVSEGHENERCRVYTITQIALNNGYQCPHAHNLNHCTKSGCGQPIDCEGEWTEYSACKHVDGEHKNEKCRTYKVSTESGLGGQECPHKDGLVECTTNTCSQPVDCVGAWGEYTTCAHDSKDHKNRRCRTYGIATNAAHNGFGCPYTNSFEQCTTEGCAQPVDCLGAWGAYTECERDQITNSNKKCRTYNVERASSHNGYTCPFADSYVQCTMSGCPQSVDCEGEFGAYGPCKYNKDEHKNKRCRLYKVTVETLFEGKACPYANQHNQCTTGGCAQPVDCVGAWGAYDACHYEEADHENERCRIYSISQAAANNGFGCPHEDKLKHCTKSGCGQPVDCEGEWTSFGACKHVAAGHKNEKCRTYKVTTKADLNGKSCPIENNKVECTTNSCSQPVDCVGDWGSYGTCFYDDMQHKNLRCRTYVVATSAAHNGFGCPYANTFQECTSEGCAAPVDCLGAWSEYEACEYDKTLHKNKKCRTYVVERASAHDGYTCPYAHSYVQCSTELCNQPVDCAGAWEDYGSCFHDKNSHQNKRCRLYKVSVESKDNGHGCPYTNKLEQCTTEECAQPVDCVGAWGTYSVCKYVPDDHANERCRVYSVSQVALNNGYDCPYKDSLTQCTNVGCGQPIDCEGEWGAYDSCTHVAAEHKNEKCRTYKVTTEAHLNGKLCPFEDNKVECTTEQCSQPVDCVGDWGAYSACFHDVQDHKNRRCRVYAITTNVAHNGYGCPYANAYKQCTTEGCAQPVDCLGAWEEYGVCVHDEEAHKNKKCRTYVVSRANAHNGYTCPYADSYVQCSTSLCNQPVDCVGAWDDYAECYHDEEAHDNKRCRLYKVSVASAHNGHACPYADKLEQCTNEGCAQPVDCVGAWSAYDECHYEVADHENERCREYIVSQPALNNGYTCPHEDKLKHCTKSGCGQPIDCEGEWSLYGSCNHVTAGHKNERCRTYKVTTAADLSGVQCPFEDKKVECTTNSCSQPVDCVGDWGSYGACFHDSDDHKNRRCRHYVVSTAVAHNGYGCPYLDNYKQCTTEGCSQPVDCLGAWSEYDACIYDKDMHKNKKCRTYTVERAASHNGYTCPYADSYIQCSTNMCNQPVDCVGAWDKYNDCFYDKDAHKNKKCRTYKVSVAAENNGYACPYANQLEQCTNEGCAQPVDCVGAWATYGECLYKDDDHENERCRVYAVSQVAMNNGYACPYEDKHKHCTKSGCGQPVDCEGAWGSYSACKHVAAGHKNDKCRTYAVNTKAELGGKDCPHKDGLVECTTTNCTQPVDCVGDWGAYSACFHDVQDHKNRRCRVYAITTNVAHNGYGCPYANAYKQCTTEGCAQPVDCLGAWEKYGACIHDEEAHKNKKCRTYVVSRANAHNGYACPYADSYVQCSTELCNQPVDCVGAWDNYSECYHDKDAHDNKRCRTYKISVESDHNGYDCPFEDKLEQCTAVDCSQPVDCVGAWDDFSECSHDEEAHKNKRCRTYKVSVASAHNGHACPYTNKLEQCTTEECAQPVDCVGSWGEYAECKYVSEGHENERCRVYTITQIALNNGYQCPHAHNLNHCTKSGCGQPIDCEGEWTEYSACKHVDGEHKNEKCRTYKVSTESGLGGQECPHKDGLVECTTNTCSQPVDCVGAWGEYTTCAHDSKDHKNRRCRTYTVTTAVAHNGFGCPYTNQLEQCTTEGCAQPVDCLGAWGAYGACIHDDDTHKNKKCRTYVVSRSSAHNGYTCPYADSYVQCSTALCTQPVDCVGAWDKYDDCVHNEEAHNNKRCRLYKVSVAAANNGYACPYTNKLEQCTTEECAQPVDCVGAWSEYAACEYLTHSHENERCREYIVSQPAANNGYTCPHADKLKHCTKSGCGQPVDCEGEWSLYGSCNHVADGHKNERCRTYKIAVEADLNGKQCPFEDKKVECTTNSCSQPVDCVGDWGAYAPCFHDSNKHKNIRCRVYAITTNVAHNGFGCPYTNAYKQCTTEGCAQPVDCLGAWSDYDACKHDDSTHVNKKCRTYEIERPAAQSGYACPYAAQYVQCTTVDCAQPVDCVGAWDEYAECFHDSEAHNNKRCRLYKVSVAAANSGYACPYAHELEQCTTEECAQPVDCVGSWSDYESCHYNNKEEKNERCRMYSVTQVALNDGYKCPFEHDERQCMTGGCGQPIDCEGAWTAYDSCKHVADGHKNEHCRSYKVVTAADLNGKLCPFLDGLVECTVKNCTQPVDCVGEWGAYGACYHDDQDHKNRRCRTYGISTNAAFNGYGCPYANAYKQCTTEGCAQPVDCLGAWEQYGACTHDDKTHKNKKCRTYAVSRAAAHDGYACPYADSYEQCTVSGCTQPVDCEGDWDIYGSCYYDKDTHKNKRCRLYKVRVFATHNGYACPYRNEYRQCTAEECPQPVDCVGSWGDYDACHYENYEHENERCRIYSVTQPALNSGYACPHSDKLKQCTKSGCGQPIDCEGEWTEYGSCNHVEDDHKNERCRTYVVNTQPDLGGKACPHTDGLIECESKTCTQPVDCVGDWGAYGTCFHDDQDHKNRRCRFYAISTNLDHNGYGCPYANAYKQCTTEGCAQPVDCFGQWGSYTDCVYDENQHTNTRCRTYVVERPSAHSGYACPYTDSYVQCSTELCVQPVDCVGAWDEYAECYHDTEEHKNKRCRLYKVAIAAANNGYACPYTNEFEQCTTEECAQPVDCVGAWGDYDACHYDEADHENERCRIYEVSQPALNSGYACPHEDKLKQCTKNGCGQPVDCEGEWTNYGSCNHVAADHKNERCRTFLVSTKADLGGKLCPFKDGLVECEQESCEQPVDCVGDWGAYGTCFHDSNDHKNRRCRVYTVTTNVAHNGYGCPYKNTYKQCTTEGCAQPVDCLGQWGEYDVCKYDTEAHKNKRCRTYEVERAAAHSGYACPYADSYVQCTVSGCTQPVDCVGAWDKYDECFYDAEGHENKRCRLYKISTNAAHNGFACPFEDNLKQCTKDACSQPVDCVGDWKEQGGCWFDQIAEENVKCRRYEVSLPSAYNGTQCDFTHNELKCSSQGCGAPKDCVGEWSDYGECKLDAGVGLNTRCRLYNIVSAAENNGKECGYTQNFQSCTTSGCEQATPPSPEGSNSTTNGTLVDGEGSEENENGDGQNTDDGKSKDGQEENSESAEDGSALGESEEDKETSTASAGGMALIGGAVAGAVCCLMGLGFVYHRQKRKRDAAYTPSADYQAVSQGSKPANASSRQSMLLMNPMFGLTGKSRKSTIAMKSGARMSFLSNPLFDKEDEDEDVMPSIAESPQGSDGEGSELLGGETGRAPSASAYSNPLYSTTKGNAGNAAASEQSIEDSMELLGKEFEASISQLSESVVETTTGRDLEFALHTWQELSSCLVESKDEVVSAEASAQGDSSEQMTSDKLHILKQSLNKIEQGTLLNSSMSTNEKSDFCKLINQARSKLRSVEKLHSYRRSRGSTAGPATAEWQKARMKLKAIAKFRQDKK